MVLGDEFGSVGLLRRDLLCKSGRKSPVPVVWEEEPHFYGWRRESRSGGEEPVLVVWREETRLDVP